MDIDSKIFAMRVQHLSLVGRPTGSDVTSLMKNLCNHCRMASGKRIAC